MSTHPTRSNAALAARANAIAGRGRIVPVADHRTIRLSVESNALLAGVYRCHERTISGIRTGSIGVPLSVAERRARVLRVATGVPYRLGDHQLLVGYRFGGGILAWAGWPGAPGRSPRVPPRRPAGGYGRAVRMLAKRMSDLARIEDGLLAAHEFISSITGWTGNPEDVEDALIAIDDALFALQQLRIAEGASE